MVGSMKVAELRRVGRREIFLLVLLKLGVNVIVTEGGVGGRTWLAW